MNSSADWAQNKRMCFNSNTDYCPASSSRCF